MTSERPARSNRNDTGHLPYDLTSQEATLYVEGLTQTCAALRRRIAELETDNQLLRDIAGVQSDPLECHEAVANPVSGRTPPSLSKGVPISFSSGGAVRTVKENITTGDAEKGQADKKRRVSAVPRRRRYSVEASRFSLPPNMSPSRMEKTDKTSNGTSRRDGSRGTQAWEGLRLTQTLCGGDKDLSFMEFATVGINSAVFAGFRPLRPWGQKSEVLSRFPKMKEEGEGANATGAFVRGLEDFCFPNGVGISLVRKESGMLESIPENRSHILQFTDCDNASTYGCCLVVTHIIKDPAPRLVKQLLEREKKHAAARSIQRLVRRKMRRMRRPRTGEDTSDAPPSLAGFMSPASTRSLTPSQGLGGTEGVDGPENRGKRPETKNLSPGSLSGMINRLFLSGVAAVDDGDASRYGYRRLSTTGSNNDTVDNGEFRSKSSTGTAKSTNHADSRPTGARTHDKGSSEVETPSSIGVRDGDFPPSSPSPSISPGHRRNRCESAEASPKKLSMLLPGQHHGLANNDLASATGTNACYTSDDLSPSRERTRSLPRESPPKALDNGRRGFTGGTILSRPYGPGSISGTFSDDESESDAGQSTDRDSFDGDSDDTLSDADDDVRDGRVKGRDGAEWPVKTPPSRLARGVTVRKTASFVAKRLLPNDGPSDRLLAREGLELRRSDGGTGRRERRRVEANERKRDGAWFVAVEVGYAMIGCHRNHSFMMKVLKAIADSEMPSDIRATGSLSPIRYPRQDLRPSTGSDRTTSPPSLTERHCASTATVAREHQGKRVSTRPESRFRSVAAAAAREAKGRHKRMLRDRFLCQIREDKSCAEERKKISIHCQTFLRTPLDITAVALETWSSAVLFASVAESSIITALNALLLENNLVVCGRDLALVSITATALLSLLDPLKWEGVFVPVVPAKLMDVLESPVPTLVGVQSPLYPSFQTAGDVAVLDLDKIEEAEQLILDSVSRELPRASETLVASMRKLNTLKGSMSNRNARSSSSSGRNSRGCVSSQRIGVLRWDHLQASPGPRSASLFHATSYISGMTTDEKKTVSRLRSLVRGHVSQFCGDLETPGAWSKYGTLDSQSGTFEFRPQCFTEPLEAQLKFKRGVASTQMFVSFVDRCRACETQGSKRIDLGDDVDHPETKDETSNTTS